MPEHDAEVLVIGGGPAGAVAARELARRGTAVLLVDRSAFPRFHIGESFLPRLSECIDDLGLGAALAQLAQVEKLGAEFTMGHGRDEPSAFSFASQLIGRVSRTLNIERASFDAMLLDAAREAGAEVRERLKVQRIETLRDGHVVVQTDRGPLAARYLIDASGQGAVVGRHLGTRRVDPEHRKVAYFAHTHGVWRHEGEKAGYPLVAICDEGWLWLIPIDEERTSVGLVIDERAARCIDVPASGMLEWGVRRCPAIRRRCADARFPDGCQVTSDFSYACRPYAGPGYFLIGDAATFLDPIFSSGVCLGVMSGARLAADLTGVLDGRRSIERVRRDHVRYVEGSTSVFFRLVRLFYHQGFRELFLHGQGPVQIHRGIMSLLAGQVFPRPPRSLRWRLHLMELLSHVQRRYPIVPRRERFSLLETPAASHDAMVADSGDDRGDQTAHLAGTGKTT